MERVPGFNAGIVVTVTGVLVAFAEPPAPVAVTSRTRLPELVGTIVVPLPTDAPESNHRRA
jgi:hypothetical protein